ncbi:hypothetical protein HYS93_01140 [Candidatus Daviesbacteria bacterium]|nr:hypothetical protein [Candidatus Daviesbacteria bacterium]
MNKFLVIFFLLLLPTTNYPVYAQELSPCPVNREEAAPCNLVNRLEPKEAVRVVENDRNLFQKVVDAFNRVRELFWGGSFFQQQNADELFGRSEAVHQAYLPSELKPKTADPVASISAYLGEKASPQKGFYCIDLPEFPNVTSMKIKDCERSFEKAVFPTGICPITAQQTGQCP